MYLDIGKAVYEDNKPVHLWEDGKNGVIVISAMPQYGKSYLTANILNEIAHHTDRRMILFDYRGEYKGMEFPNMKSKDNMRCIPNLHLVENIGFKISEFTNPSDWEALDFKGKTSQFISEVAGRVDLHGNNPEIFFDIAINPSKYNMKVAHYSMSESCIRLGQFLHYFTRENTIDNWQDLVMKYKYLHLNLGIDTDSDLVKARMYVGKILEKISTPKFLMTAKPFMLFEEGDLLCPPIFSADAPVPTSLIMITKYILKWQKYHPKLMFLVQSLQNINPIVSNMANVVIQGAGDYPQEAKMLKWDAKSNYREFMLIKKGEWKKVIFSPHEICCMMGMFKV